MKCVILFSALLLASCSLTTQDVLDAVEPLSLPAPLPEPILEAPVWSDSTVERGVIGLRDSVRGHIVWDGATLQSHKGKANDCSGRFCGR